SRERGGGAATQAGAWAARRPTRRRERDAQDRPSHQAAGGDPSQAGGGDAAAEGPEADPARARARLRAGDAGRRRPAARPVDTQVGEDVLDRAEAGARDRSGRIPERSLPGTRGQARTGQGSSAWGPSAAGARAG